MDDNNSFSLSNVHFENMVESFLKRSFPVTKLLNIQLIVELLCAISVVLAFVLPKPIDQWFGNAAVFFLVLAVLIVIKYRIYKLNLDEYFSFDKIYIKPTVLLEYIRSKELGKEYVQYLYRKMMRILNEVSSDADVWIYEYYYGDDKTKESYLKKLIEIGVFDKEDLMIFDAYKYHFYQEERDFSESQSSDYIGFDSDKKSDYLSLLYMLLFEHVDDLNDRIKKLIGDIDVLIEKMQDPNLTKEFVSDYKKEHGDKFGIEVFSYCTSRRQDLLDKIIDMQKETNRLLDLRIGIDRKEGEA